MTSQRDEEIRKIVQQEIEDKKEEIKKEAREEARKELKQEIVENVRKETESSEMSRRQFLKKAGLGAAGLGALSFSPAAANLKLTKNGIFGSSNLSQEIKNVETLNASTVDTEELVDGAGVSHTEEISDLGTVFLHSYDKTVGSGSITNNSGVVQLREPGNSSAKEESRLYSHILEFDPRVSRSIRINLQNITIDNDGDAYIKFAISDSPDQRGLGNDGLLAQAKGNGVIRAITSENGTTNINSDSTQDNSYVSSLNYIEISWDGSELTVEAYDGSKTIAVTNSTNYPSGENLNLKIAASDENNSASVKVDFDLESVVIR